MFPWSMAKLLHCVDTACPYRETHRRSPATCLLAQQSSKAHKITTHYMPNQAKPILAEHTLHHQIYTDPHNCGDKIVHEAQKMSAFLSNLNNKVWWYAFDCTKYTQRPGIFLVCFGPSMGDMV